MRAALVARHLRLPAILVDQLAVASLLDDFAILHDNDMVSKVPDCR